MLEAFKYSAQNTEGLHEINSGKPALLSTVESHLGKIIKVEEISGGLVHHVFRLEGETQVGYAKIRSDHYVALPDIPTQPDLIRYEAAAMKLLSVAFPDVFPHLLTYIPEESLILMTEVMPDQDTLDRDLDTNKTTPEQITDFGEKLAEIHSTFSNGEQSLREDGDDTYYTQNLYYRLGYSQHPVLSRAIIQLNAMPRQIILGDLSPKNIGISNNGSVSICDLESVHRGNTIFDLGFFTGSLLVHSMQDRDRAYKLIHALHEGYLDGMGKEVDQKLLSEITLGIAIYRLLNDVIPYKLPLSAQQRQEKTEIARKLLFDANLSLGKLIEDMTYER